MFFNISVRLFFSVDCLVLMFLVVGRLFSVLRFKEEIGVRMLFVLLLYMVWVWIICGFRLVNEIGSGFSLLDLTFVSGVL